MMLCMFVRFACVLVLVCVCECVGFVLFVGVLLLFVAIAAARFMLDSRLYRMLGICAGAGWREMQTICYTVRKLVRSVIQERTWSRQICATIGERHCCRVS